MSELRITMISRSRFAREGIARLLDQEDGFTVCSHHGSIERALPAISEQRPDIVVIDFADAHDRGAMSKLAAVSDDLAVVVSGVPLTGEAIIPWAKAGATSYIRLDASGAEWAAALRAAVVGNVADPAVAGILNRYIADSSTQARAPAVDNTWRSPPEIEESAARVGLTPRERQVLTLVDRGLSTKHIAEELDCAPSTVKAHIASVLAKYNVHRRGEAAALFRNSEQSTPESGKSVEIRKNYSQR